MSVALSEEEFKAALPTEMRRNVNPLLIMKINNILNNPDEWEYFKNDLLSYTSVLQQGKFKMDGYINAVRYVGFKVRGFTNKDAYHRTFPEKYNRFIAEGVSSKDIASYSTAYNKSKLVNLIYEQTLIPTHILNAATFQQAINVQAKIMNDPDASFKVRSDAANSLMSHLKAPEAKKIELDIGVNTGGIIEDYEKAMSAMVESQMKLISAGGDVKQIANAAIPTVEAIDI